MLRLGLPTRASAGAGSGKAVFAVGALNPVYWGRPGFDVGREAVQGMPRSSHLVKRLETINANDERFALAA